MLPIPEQWKSSRQRIVEVYIFRRKSTSEIAEELGYKSPSFVRLVIRQYRDFVKESAASEKEKQLSSPIS